MTPRRIAVTIIWLLAFGTAYVIYDRFLGWIDGLPLLPSQMVEKRDGAFRPPSRPSSPTIERLKEAFGQSCPEAIANFYPTQLEFRNGDNSTVVAAGQFPSNPASNRVELTPFSLAVFGKPRPDHLREPGEINEISTFHSDKAVLEFDRIINSPVDLNTAKLVRMELISDPEHTLPDRRMGRVHIANNQRSSDPNRRFLLKTIGPVFYRDSKVRFKITNEVMENLKKANVPQEVLAKLTPLKDKNKDYPREDFEQELTKALKQDTERWKDVIMNHATPSGMQTQFGPDLWTDAPIEGIDHSNIPRREGTEATTALTLSEEVRNAEAVSNILKGHRLPPPTVTAIGLRVYLASEESKKQQPKKEGGGFSGVRRIELLEQVTVHLWVESGQGLVGAEGKSSTIPEAPPAATAVAGGLVPAAYAIRELGRDLLQIETRGPFAFDAEKNLARFDVLPQADPNLTNDVRATKIPPRPGVQTLFSQVLELEFNGSTNSAAEQPPPQKPKTAAQATTANKGSPSSSGGGTQFKRLHAWTYTPGRFLTISSDSDQMEAYGQDLVREQAIERTQLTGSPLYAVQQRNILTAGSPKSPGVLIIEQVPGPNGPEKRTTIQGSGRLELYDAAAKANTMAAAWQKSMVQTKERVNERELDLYTLTESAQLEDLQSSYWLKGNLIKMWMIPSANGESDNAKSAKSAAPASPASRSQLHHLLAIGDVSSHSSDLDIDHTDQLTVQFHDIPAPEPVTPVPAPAPKSPSPMSNQVAGNPDASSNRPLDPMPQQQPAAPPAAPDASPEPKEPEKPKPPMKVRARTIDAWVNRYPQPKPPAAPGAKPAPNAPGENAAGGGGMKNQLEKALCEGMVVAHQEPDDPSKPEGTDILGSRMLIDSTPEGSKLTVWGWDSRAGEVHNEGTALIGPKVIVDQLYNYAEIDGQGSLVLPAGSDLSGADLKKNDQKQEQKSDPVVIHFREKMQFWGTKKLAVFTGKVNASQGGSWIVCSTMKVNLDRPVYFTQTNRPAASSKPASGPTPKQNGSPPAKGPNGQTARGSTNPDEDKAKIEIVYCYPAPADAAENEVEKIVVYTQVERDPETGKPTRQQQLRVRELTLRAQVKDESRGEPYRMVLADGPGVCRIWAPESKDDEAGNGAPKQPGAAPQP
ncbi:MAG TPA: hypothetical protein VG097_09690, partial [Gemmata sp.]|nr:hypothetical protein [Gemmata sp.]